MGYTKHKYERTLIRKDFLSPEYLYFPLNENVKLHVSNNSEVMKEDILFECNNFNYYSNVSGNVLGKKTIDDSQFLIVKNNFKEKYRHNKSIRKDIFKISKDEFIEILNNDNNYDVSDNIKFFINNFENIDSVVLNLITTEYSDSIFSDFFVSYNHEIMEMLSYINNTFSLKSCFIVVSDKNENDIEHIANLSGLFPDISLRLTNCKYPYSHPLLISKKLKLNNAVVLNPFDVYYLYSILKRKKIPFEREVLVISDSIDNDFIVSTKNNILISDLLRFLKIDLNENAIILSNSKIGGKTISADDILTNSIYTIIIADKNKTREKECINCGLCNKNCPLGLKPQLYLMNHVSRPQECIKCNMCSFVCPSDIKMEVSNNE